MSALANTMQGYLTDSETDPSDMNPSVVISQPLDVVVKTMADPFQLPNWTGHRVIREIDGRLVESRMHGDIDLNISTEDHAVCYTWSHEGQQKSVWMHLAEEKHGVNVHVDLSNVPSEEKEKLQSIIQVELDMLAAHIEGEPERISESDRRIIDQWHLEIHQRKGL